MTADEKLVKIREIVTWHREAQTLGPDAEQIVYDVLAVIDDRPA